MAKTKAFLLAMALVGLLVTASWPQSGDKIAILPFRINSSEPLAFLKEGLLDMLSSRLGRTPEMTIVDKSVLKRALLAGKDVDVTADLLARIQRETGANFLVAGSLTKVGELVSLDATLYRVPVSQPLSAVFLQAEGLNSLIPKMNELAAEIVKELKATSTPPVIATKPKEKEEEKATVPALSEAEARLAVLEKRLKALEAAREAVPPEVGKVPAEQAKVPPGASPEFIVAPGRGKAGGDYWQSRDLPYQISGLDVGDVDGDGKNELVVIEESRLYLYRNEKGNMVQLSQLGGDKGDTFIQVDILDIDGDGQGEIFVTNVVKSLPSSFVLKYKDGKFTKLASELPWYFKAMQAPQLGRVLLGQEPGLLGFFSDRVFVMGFKGGKLIPEQPVEIPAGKNIYSLAMGEFKEKGVVQFVALDEEAHLQLYKSPRSSEWRSGDQYAETIKYLEKDRGKDDSLTESVFVASGRRAAIPPRVVVRPGSDGASEIIVAKNYSFGKGFLGRGGKFFTDSEIHNLAWNGLGLGERWRTKKIDAYIADMQIKDFDNDGKDDLVAGLVIESKGLLSRPKSAIIFYRLQ